MKRVMKHVSNSAEIAAYARRFSVSAACERFGLHRSSIGRILEKTPLEVPKASENSKNETCFTGGETPPGGEGKSQWDRARESFLVEAVERLRFLVARANSSDDIPKIAIALDRIAGTKAVDAVLEEEAAKLKDLM